MTFSAIASKYYMLEKEPNALQHSQGDGWCLIDELPDTDQLSGVVMGPATFAGRWQQHPAEVMTHVINNHTGELVELVGWWER